MQIAISTYENATVAPNGDCMTFTIEVPEKEIQYLLLQIGEEKIRQFINEYYYVN